MRLPGRTLKTKTKTKTNGSFPRRLSLRWIFLVGIIVFPITCNYDRAPFYYADISPQAPKNVAITSTNATSATIRWTNADDSAYPPPSFEVYTILGTTTNLSSTHSNNIFQADISGLTSQSTYSAFVRATNQAGSADSAPVSFTTR